jgi:hypothetical protein
VAAMATDREAFSVCVIAGKIYVTGGEGARCISDEEDGMSIV